MLLNKYMNCNLTLIVTSKNTVFLFFEILFYNNVNFFLEQ